MSASPLSSPTARSNVTSTAVSTSSSALILSHRRFCVASGRGRRGHSQRRYSLLAPRRPARNFHIQSVLLCNTGIHVSKMRGRRPQRGAAGRGRGGTGRRPARAAIASGAMALLSGLLALLLAPQVLANRNAVGQTPIMGWSGCEYTALPAAHARLRPSPR